MATKPTGFLCVFLAALSQAGCAAQKPSDVSQRPEYPSIVGTKDVIWRDNVLYWCAEEKCFFVTPSDLHFSGIERIADIKAGTAVRIERIVKNQCAFGHIEAFEYLAVVIIQDPRNQNEIIANIRLALLEKASIFDKDELFFDGRQVVIPKK